MTCLGRAWSVRRRGREAAPDEVHHARRKLRIVRNADSGRVVGGHSRGRRGRREEEEAGGAEGGARGAVKIWPKPLPTFACLQGGVSATQLLCVPTPMSCPRGKNRGASGQGRNVGPESRRPGYSQSDRSGLAQSEARSTRYLIRLHTEPSVRRQKKRRTKAPNSPGFASRPACGRVFTTLTQKPLSKKKTPCHAVILISPRIQNSQVPSVLKWVLEVAHGVKHAAQGLNARDAGETTQEANECTYLAEECNSSGGGAPNKKEQVRRKAADAHGSPAAQQSNKQQTTPTFTPPPKERRASRSVAAPAM